MQKMLINMRFHYIKTIELVVAIEPLKKTQHDNLIKRVPVKTVRNIT